MDTSEGQSSSAPATAKGLSEPLMLVKACQCLKSNGKVLTAEAKIHITSMTVKCSCIQAILELRHPRSCIGLSPGSLYIIILQYLLCLTECNLLIMPV